MNAIEKIKSEFNVDASRAMSMALDYTASVLCHSTTKEICAGMKHHDADYQSRVSAVKKSLTFTHDLLDGDESAARRSLSMALSSIDVSTDSMLVLDRLIKCLWLRPTATPSELLFKINSMFRSSNSEYEFMIYEKENILYIDGSARYLGKKSSAMAMVDAYVYQMKSSPGFICSCPAYVLAAVSSIASIAPDFHCACSACLRKAVATSEDDGRSVHDRVSAHVSEINTAIDRCSEVVVINPA